MAAKAAIAPYSGHPSAFPVDQALSKKLPAGVKFAYFQCGASTCALVGSYLKQAVAAIGGTLTVVNTGLTAASSQAAASSVLALKPDVAIVNGVDPSFFGGALKKLSDAGIKVVSISVSKDYKPFGISFNYIDSGLNQLGGRLLADWVIAHEGAKANAVFYGIPELTFSAPMYQAFAQELKKNCPSCTTRTVPIGIATLGTTSVSTIVTDLQAHPATNVAVFPSGEEASGLPAGLKAAGLSIDTIAFAPLPETLQDVKNGRITAVLAVDFRTATWTAVDAAARLVEGEQPTAGETSGEVPLEFLEQKDITFDPSQGWPGYADVAQRYAALWHTAG